MSTFTTPVNHFQHRRKLVNAFVCKSLFLFLAASCFVVSFGFAQQYRTTSCGGYQVTTKVIYNSPKQGQTTFKFIFQNLHPGNGDNGTLQDLSHWSQKLGPCVSPADLVSGGKYEADESQNCLKEKALKFNQPVNGGDPFTFTQVLNGTHYIPVLVDAVFKNGSGCCTGKVYGIGGEPPACDIIGDKTVCPGSKTVFKGPVGSGLKYKWIVEGRGTIIGADNERIVIVKAGSVCGTSFKLSLKVSNHCGLARCSRIVTVDDNTPPHIKCPEDITVDTKKNVPAPNVTQVKAWDACGKVIVKFVKDEVVEGTYSTIIYRTYKATDVCGNIAKCTQKIKVKHDNDNQGLIEQGKVATQYKFTAKAYPNPYGSEVHFQIVSPVSGKALLELYDLLGRRLAVVYDGKVEAGVQQSVIYSVPAANRVPLIYKLTVGDQTFHGRLIPRDDK